MNNIFNITGNMTVNVTEPGKYSFRTEERASASLAIVIKHEGDLEVQFEYEFGASSNIRMIVINHNDGHLRLSERYLLHADCDVKVASCQLQSFGCDVKSSYDLLESGSRILVQGAILADCGKNFELTTRHKAPVTSAQINSFGVVIGKGRCEMVVTNSIEKGMHQSETHQTTRLLTYDKTAVGKILPILYIDENDVAASHAASLGQPDESQLFYMQTRGLSRAQALELVTVGYLQPVTQFIDDEELNRMLSEEIEQKVKLCLMS
ncbi:MAG: SufD family Fe-S cluster assembly protein [Erysipelotrichaceae bacterium]|nr:SufD family Fe-S cluster assembly protein [Erysipelotrichaceae bacterium]